MWKCEKFENLKMKRSVRDERSVRPRANLKIWKCGSNNCFALRLCSAAGLA